MKVVVFCGPPCSGKSTAAVKFQRRHKYSLLSVDAICENTNPGQMADQNIRNNAYHLIHTVFLPEILSSGGSAIIDATYGREEQRQNLLNAIRNYPVNLVIKELRISPDKAAQRFLKRKDHMTRELDVERVRFLAKNYKRWRYP